MESTESRVAVYIDFDNVVISRASQAKDLGVPATLAIDALLDFAARYGRVTISRAYANWSVRANADYREQLVARAVELVQLFPATKTKNGADIRLAVDAIEDLYLHPSLTHVVIAAGDSDFVPLAQRARRLGRFVLGIGVAGSISKSLATACDLYVDYDELVADRRKVEDVADKEDGPAVTTADPQSGAKGTPVRTSRRPYLLINEALQGLAAQYPDREWHALGAVKHRILQIEPTFRERDHGANTFSELLSRYASQVEVKDNRARLR